MTLELSPRWSGPTAPFVHSWEGIVNVDQFRWLVRRDMQDQLELARRELHARHVRAVGLFDDEMRVFCPSPGSFMGFEPKRPRTNWQITDYVMDSLLDRGLSPMITTSFIPSAMASGPLTVFTTKAHTAPPSDWAQWSSLVQEAVRHSIERYSLPVVRTWHFEVWNEPNLQHWFWGGNQADFFRLWEVTHQAIKSVDAQLQLGGPSTARADWFEEFLAFCGSRQCLPDYLIGHLYNNDSTSAEALAPFDGLPTVAAGASADTAIQVMRSVRRSLQGMGFSGPLHWNEWGRSFHGVDFRREQASEAAFIARTMAEVSQEAEIFSYWCLSDIYDQVGYGREAFHGGYGLLNLQGLRKPSYHAFQLLSKLGHRRVEIASPQADSFHNAVATIAPGRDAQVMIYAYDHADQPERRTVQVRIELPAGFQRPRLYRIDESENNVIAGWRELGAPAYLSRDQTRDLAAKNALQPSNALQVERADAKAFAVVTMESPGVALLEMALDPAHGG